jgi:hypothetical protein
MRRNLTTWCGRLAALLGVLSAVLGGGCVARGSSAGEVSALTTQPGVASPGTGVVEFVRGDQRYLVVRGERLPNAREQATVFRDETPVGIVRFTGQRQGDHVAADIVEGVLQPGDRVVY